MSCPFMSLNAFWSKDQTVSQLMLTHQKDGHRWKWEPLMDKKKAPNAINTSPRFLGIWLAVHVGRSLIKPGHAHVMTSPCSLQNVLRQQRLNLPKRPTTKTSQQILQISSGSSMERKKNARSLYVQHRSVQLKVFFKKNWNVWSRQTRFVCWKFRGP